MKNTTTTTSNRLADYIARQEKAESLYNKSEIAVYICLRARHSKSGLHFLQELQNGQSTDKGIYNRSEKVERLTTVENQLNEYRNRLAEEYKTKATADRQSNSLANSDELRTEWAKVSKSSAQVIEILRNHIKQLTTEQQSIYKALEVAFTDRADLVQVGVMTLLQLEQEPAPITASILLEFDVEDISELSETEREQAQEKANFKAVCSAIGKSISLVATPDALNTTKTVCKRATAEQLADWINRHGGTGKEHIEYAYRKRTRASDCFVTMEYKEYKDESKRGYYYIYHYKTITPYSYIEDLLPKSDEGETLEKDVEYIKSYNPLVTTPGDLESLDDLYTTANLTDTEQIILEQYARAMRYHTAKADIISYVARNTDLSTATIYRKLENIKKQLRPYAEKMHYISKSRKTIE